MTFTIKGFGWKLLNLLLTSFLIRFVTCYSGTDYERSQTKFLVRNVGEVCLSKGCVLASATILNSIDPSVNPCDNFYKFACGNYIKETAIPDDKSFTISFNMIEDHLVTQLRNIVEQPTTLYQPKAFKLLKQFYNVCINTTAIDADNLKTAKSLLKELGGWPLLEGRNWDESKFHWTKAMHKFRENGLRYDSLLGVYLASDPKDSSKRLINIDQASLGLRREYLLMGFKNDLVKAYYEYLIDVAAIFGADRATASKDLKDVIQFQTELAKISVPNEERRNLSNFYNPATIEQVQKVFPEINWLEYLNNIVNVPNVKLSLHDVVDIDVPKFIAHLFRLLAKTPKRVQANYIMSHFIQYSASYLTTALTNLELEYRKVTEGKEAAESRRKHCIEESVQRMRIAAGALYVRTYVDEEAKNAAWILVSNLRYVFSKLLQNVDWMDEMTRYRALEKAIAMHTHVGYPSEFLNDWKIEEYYSKLQPSDNYLQFSLNIQKFDDDYNFALLPMPVNRTDWVTHSAATTVNAFYNVNENSVQIPAGILQGVFFDKNRPNYVNYGAMGCGIGHELTHGFDDIGRLYDPYGNMKEWWSERSKQAFLAKAQCIIDQYSRYYVPEVNLTLNGINTQGENIADTGGAKIAYLAYSAWADYYGEEARLPALERFTPKQMFWISLANLWCSKTRPEVLKFQILTNPHVPSYFRVLGTLQNSEYFARDFNCPPGSCMNPWHKCSVW